MRFDAVSVSSQARRSVRTQSSYNEARANARPAPIVQNQRYTGAGLATPRELVNFLDQYIIGQEYAKKVLSVAIYGHMTRIRANIGPPRSPLPMEDEWQAFLNMHRGVASANVNPVRRGNTHGFPRLNPRDFLPAFEKSNVLPLTPHTFSGKTLLVKTLARILDVPFSVSDATSFTQVWYKATDVGEDVEMAIQRLLQASDYDPLRASMGIVYIDEIDKIARKSSSTGSDGTRDVGGEGVQQALLRMMEGAVVSVQSKSEVFHVDTSNVLFILSGAFVGLDKIISRRKSKGSIGFTANLASDSSLSTFFTSNKVSHNFFECVEPDAFFLSSFIPEFISRVPSITTLAPLTLYDLRKILIQVKGSLLSQYAARFQCFGTELQFTDAALDEVCRKAVARGGGARGLRGIMARILSLFDVAYVLITEDVVRGVVQPLLWREDQAGEFHRAVLMNEEAYYRSHKPLV
ncbi:hypothetical protein FISHEDRAFT_48326 [Fistulina hepatica ATCC 64428]|uniref:Clp ATPase C-terminal domain-containing protein n=1 Tax=Fistulina hepatica ATCC 64428 TaxID=1128425 RepID=A0A0D7A5A3_9AGAR|nr:hypothetical protein FISHEDRAFT_48326 [Fistulina hepatica ATCC 64428]